MTTDNFGFYLQNRLIQTSQTGGQQYSDTSPFSIPCPSTHTYALRTLGNWIQDWPWEWIDQHWNDNRADDGAGEVNSGQGVNLCGGRLEVALGDRADVGRVVVGGAVVVDDATRLRAVVDAARLGSAF